MKCTKVEELPQKENPHGVSVRLIYDHPEAQASVIMLRPGESLRKHVTPVDVFFYVLEGEGEVEIGEETAHVTKDMIIESPAKIPHRLFNQGKNDFRFMVLKAPKPSAKSVMQ